ncbi:MAG: transglycosylase SLT domain-containing protein [Anaerolineae bacterium]|nr:transglycosylase SLT domain-containing protein [Anaerolineae bacterium]
MRGVPQIIRKLPALWVTGVLAFLFTVPLLLNGGLGLLRGVGFWHAGNGEIAPFFTPQVQHWSHYLGQWGVSYGIDPNLLATIMQIESCGHPTVSSPAGAQGLFQVMPFHFAPGEDMLSPEVNVLRSALFIHECKRYAGEDVGLILACYNGGPSVTRRPFANWPAETQRYFTWGTGIYQDAVQGQQQSDTLDQWLAAGGNNLCNRASVALQQN